MFRRKKSANKINIISDVDTDKEVAIEKVNDVTVISNSFNGSTENAYTVEDLKLLVNKTIDNFITSFINDSSIAYTQARKDHIQRQKLSTCLDSCVTGDIQARDIVRGYIKEILINNIGVNTFNIDLYFPFNKVDKLTSADKFDIILAHYVTKEGTGSFSRFVKDYKLDTLKDDSYFISTDEIDSVFSEGEFDLSFNEKIYFITQRIYSQIKGLGVIDDVRYMDIDGISAGVYGMIGVDFGNTAQDLEEVRTRIKVPRPYDFPSIYFEGKELCLRFLSFGSNQELIRVCTNIYKYDNPGQLDQSRGYVLNDTADNCRVVVFRTKMSESWCFVLRKQNDSLTSVNFVHSADVNDAAKVGKLNYYIMRANQSTVISGAQGSGKTALLKLLVGWIPKIEKIRVFELFFETHLKNLYPFLNILCLRPTGDVSSENTLDIMKKTNGTIVILSEAAEDTDVAFFVKNTKIVSKSSITTHHATKFDSLIRSWVVSLLNVGTYKDFSLAQEAVVNAIDFNIHIDNEYGERRYISRITECVPHTHASFSYDFLKEEELNNKLDVFMSNITSYLEFKTQPKLYKENNVAEFDDDLGYYIFRPLSPERKKAIRKALRPEEREEFMKFCEEVLENGHI